MEIEVDDRLEVPAAVALVVTMDQRGSRSSPDLVDEESGRLNAELGDRLRLPFARTTGDEMQAVLADASWLVDLVLEEQRRARWWIGVGLGPLDEPLGSSAPASRGPSFYAAREAVAKAKSAPWGFWFAPRAVPFGQAMAALVPTSWIVRRRTAAQQEAVDLVRQLGQARLVAKTLGISDQAVSDRLRGAGHQEEKFARRLALDLMGAALTA